MLYITTNQPSKFRTKNWFEINYEVQRTYNKDCQVRFKTSMLKSNICDYSETYILVSKTLTIEPQEGDNPINKDKKIVLKIVLYLLIAELKCRNR